MTVPVPGSLTYAYVADGVTTVFSYPVRFLEANELYVLHEDADGRLTELGYNVDYTVTGAGNPSGGSITTLSVYTEGRILISRRTGAKQIVDLADNARNPAEAVEQQLDRMVMTQQDDADRLGRAVAVRPGAAPLLPIPFPSANKPLVWRADGLGLENGAESYDGLRDRVTSNSERIEAVASLVGQAGPIEVPVFDSALAVSFAVVDPDIKSIRVGGDDAPGDGNDGLFVEVGADPYPAPAIQDQGGRWFARPLSKQEWKAQWFGVVDNPSADQVPAVQRIVDTAAASGEAVEVSFPGGTVALNNGATNVPVEMDGTSKLTFKGPKDAIFKKTVAQRELFYGGRTTAVSEITFDGFTWDGGDIDDGSNNYPMAMMIGDDVTYRHATLLNVSSGLRVGFGASTRAASQRPRYERIRQVNTRYNGLEAFNVDDLSMYDIRSEGGAASVGTENRPIRVLQAKRVNLSKLTTIGCGCAVALNTDTTRATEDVTIEDFEFYGQTGIAAIWSQWRHKTVKIRNGRIRGGGATALIWANYPEDPAHPDSEDWHIENVDLYAGAAETSLLRMYGVFNVTRRGGKFVHVGRGLSISHYASRFVHCYGLLDLRSTSIVMDGGAAPASGNARGDWDVSGQSSVRFLTAGNTYHMPNLNQVAQSGSAGTLIGTPSTANTYITY